MTKLIVGLGNPGFRYRNTRHNIGFLVVKEIAKKFRIPLKKRIHKGIMGQGTVYGEKVNLFMPQTYMNLSGEAVEAVVNKERIELADLLIVYDDKDLKLGSIRLRKRGRSAGHNGIESIIKGLNSDGFSRLKVGIGRDNIKDVVKFVLTPFEEKEKSILKDVIEKASLCAASWVKDGPDKTMARFNA